MAGMFTPGLKVVRETRIRKVRELPVRGEVLVRIGQEVAESDIVARAEQAGELRILRVPEVMGIEPFEVIKGLKIEEGAQVKAGELLCEHSGLFGLFKTRFHSPESGTIEMVTERTGHLGLRLPAQPIQIDAYLRGKVVEIGGGKAVTIESDAALVQGIFGVGGEKKGRIRNLKIEPGKPVTAEMVPQDCAGAILVGGTLPELAALLKAAQSGAAGMVVGAIDDSVLAGYLGYDLGIALTGDEELPMTLVMTEGFGRMPMAGRVEKLLWSLEGAAASMNGATQVRAGALRPEIIIYPETAAQSAASSIGDEAGASLSVGARIRIIRVPYFGSEATVTELPAPAEKIETGAFTRVLRARLADGREVTVPRANVELL